MGNAGRVLMIPKGDYSSGTQYSPLDVVLYEGDSYVCKQSSRGNAPTNTTYWQAMTDAMGAVDELKEALTDEVETRASLGAHNLWDLHTGTFSPSIDVSYSYEDNGFRIQNSVAHEYANLNFADIPFEHNLDCVMSGSVTITSGAAMIICDGRKNGDYTRIFSISPTGDFEQAFNSGNYDTLRFYIYCTKGTSTIGNVLYSDLMICLASDPYTGYTSYAPTNYELGNNKIDASQIAPIENGATASTSYAQGAYFIHNGKFCKAKTSIASGATFTKGTNYEETTVAAELIALA